MAESKHDKFVRLAESRTNAITEGIRILGNLSNKSNYEYTDEEVDKIIKTLKKAVSELEKQFKETEDAPNKFKL